jgi:phospholipid/cholesterol/gamma-HCH transport system permease protein
MPQAKKLLVDYQAGTLSLSGELTIETLPQVLFLQNEKVNIIKATQLEKIDTAGALFILKLLKGKVNPNNLQNLRVEESSLLEFVKHQEAIKLILLKNKQAKKILKRENFNFVKLFELLGRGCYHKYVQIKIFLRLVGEITVGFVKSLRTPKHFPFKNIVGVVENSGCRALGILGLLAFLIGVVLAYQVGIQLKNYGANIFIVRLTGVAILREFGPLMAAVIIAGRSSSAFTAEIGTMKVNQEVDALMTMGISPVVRLILPKFLGMLLVFPLLIFWSDLLGMLGSMVMARGSLDISFTSFAAEFQRAVLIKQFWVGLSKAPIFATIIALVGCHQGFLVESSSESVGKHTTQSVVQAIFLIIVADAIFSILYNLLRI